VQGDGGVRVPPQGFLPGLRALADQTGALLMFDEVQTGLGRTGARLACDHEGVKPDGLTLGKALGGGLLPVSAFVARREVMDVFTPGDHGSTFGGNPLACAAGLTVARAIAGDGLLENVQARGEQLRAGLRKIQAAHPGVVSDVRGWGLINGVELAADSPLQAAQVVQACIEDGLLLVPAGPKVVRFVPPLVVTAQQVDQALERFERAVVKLKG
jgi:acetylornithine aminotransferase